MTDAELFKEMCDNGVVFGAEEEFDPPAINLNDTFCYACGDAENVLPADMPEVINIYRRFGPIGCICWAAKRRDEAPVVEYTEDPVYQSTWKALYGDATVKPNGCNQVDPRWSDDRLCLEPWEPRP